MAASFAGFIAWPDRKEVVLAEITPSLTMRGWTATGGRVNVYQMALARSYVPDLITGGVYRRCTGVRENATDLTEQASVALVEAAAGSWYWDEVAGIVYARSTTNADPDTFTVYQAFVTYYVATSGVVLNRVDGSSDTGIYYHPWLSGDLPRVSQFYEDPLLGVKIVEGGSVGFTNSAGFWHRAIPEHNWRNKRIRLLLGGSYNGQDLLRSQYVALTTMLIDDISANEGAAALALKPAPRLLDMQLPITPYTAAAYPNLGPGVEGTRKWLGWGTATIPPDLTDTSGLGVWTVADAAYQTLFAVPNVWAVDKKTKVQTLLTVGSHYTVNLSACTITVVHASFPWQDYDIVCDVTGKNLTTFAAIIKDLLQSFLGVPDAELDLASFAQADLDRPYQLAVWLKEERSIASIVSTAEGDMPSLERSVLGNLQYTPAGKWRVQIWTPGYDAAAVVPMRKEDFSRFEPDPKIEQSFSTTRVLYHYDYFTRDWLVKEHVDLLTQYTSDVRDRLTAHTYLGDASNALAMAQRVQFLAGAHPLEVEFEERGALLANASVGDIVLLTYDPMPTAGGKAVAKAFEIIQLNRALSPVLTISGRLGDLRGISTIVGHWVATGAPNWAASSAAQREWQGYWTNSGGLIDPADPNTINQSVWW